jgi:CheY-like chemotaxis protein
MMRSLLRRLLREAGIKRISEATNGGKALKYLGDRREVNPDVIICDLYMEGMSGTEFIHRLRRNKKLSSSDVPVIVLTGESDELVLDVTMQVGANSILQKPVSAYKLGAEIEAAVGCQLNTSGLMSTPIRESQWKLAPRPE